MDVQREFGTYLGVASMAAEEAPERITGTSKLLEEQGERYEHWKGGREQVDVA
jgi:hypothetical protein